MKLPAPSVSFTGPWRDLVTIKLAAELLSYDGMKTILISILQGIEAKNILRTEICKTLLATPDIRLVFLVGTKDKLDYYGREFTHPRMIYELVLPVKVSRWDRFLGFLKFKLINTETIDLRRKLAAKDNRVSFFLYPFIFLFNRIFARRIFRKFVRQLDQSLAPSADFSCLFDKYNVAAVFLAHLFDDTEAALLREAKRRGIVNVGLINSWDKLTARCMLRVLPDKLLVYNDIVKKEAVEYADMPPENVVAVGVPHYDQYFTDKPPSLDEFYKRANIDSKKRIILYSPIGKYFSDSDWDIIDLLNGFTENELRSYNVELLVRFQPNDFVSEIEIKKRPWLKYDLPGIRFSNKRGVDWDMNFADLKNLFDTLYYCSLLVCYAASITVEAAILGKPVININFEVKDKQKHSQTPTYFYGMSHYRKVLATGGIRLVNSKEELLKWIKIYLDQPEIDADGRSRLVSEQCWRQDGRAGQRIAGFLISEIGSNRDGAVA